MDNVYENALRTIADAYEGEVAAFGGKSLSTVATIVVSSGSFFQRLRDGKPFLVHNLERLAAWFRDPANWPDAKIPTDAAFSLTSIGRPPLAFPVTHVCDTDAETVSSNPAPKFDRKSA